MTHAASPQASDLKQTARDIFAHALTECSIERAFDRKLSFNSDPQSPAIIFHDGVPLALTPIRRISIVAAGKAAAPMLTALLRRLSLPGSCTLQGVLIAPTPPPALPSNIQFFAGGHPTPNAASIAGASAALALARSAAASPHDTLCLFLISGGASSMMELPLDPAISLEDTTAFHHVLVHTGATIVEMNCVRKHFSAIKGGRLALAAAPAPALSFLVSDVPAAHLDALASGPTLPDSTTVAQCRTILAKYNLLAKLPTSIQHFFRNPALPETPKPGQLNSRAITLLDSDHLAELARAHATTLGFHAIVDNTCDDWPCVRAADYLLNRIRTLRLTHPRVCLISTGEVTVTLPPTAATPSGGRNQHLALYLATQLQPSDPPLGILSAGTDGIDGNSLAAGAVIDSQTLTPANRTSALQALESFNSGPWLAHAGAAIVTGPTGQNLRDLRILLSCEDSPTSPSTLSS